MKRTISTLLLVLLCLTPVLTYGTECEDSCSDPVQLARMSPAILGASSGAVCSQSTPEAQETQNDYCTIMVSAGNNYRSGSFTANGSGNRLTLYVYACKAGSPVAHTVKICTDDGTGPPGLPTTTCTTSDSTYTPSTACTTSFEWDKITFSTMSVTNGSMYHVTIGREGAADSINYIRWGQNTEVTGQQCAKSADATTWSSVDGSCQQDFRLKVCAE